MMYSWLKHHFQTISCSVCQPHASDAGEEALVSFRRAGDKKKVAALKVARDAQWMGTGEANWAGTNMDEVTLGENDFGESPLKASGKL